MPEDVGISYLGGAAFTLTVTEQIFSIFAMLTMRPSSKHGIPPADTTLAGFSDHSPSGPFSE